MTHHLHATLITLYPEMFPGMLGMSLAGKALEAGIWGYDVVPLRDFGQGKHKAVDDTPFGGGAGMVLRPDIVAAALDKAIEIAHGKLPLPLGEGWGEGQRAIDRSSPHPARAAHHPLPGGEGLYSAQKSAKNTTENQDEARPALLYMSPRGKPLTQQRIKTLVKQKNIVILCGRFEGVDQRVLDAYQMEEVSIGDYILSGGEVAAHVVLDACIRTLPGVMGEQDSLKEESFSTEPSAFQGLLEYPHYTRPADWRGMDVPEVLRSGNHAAIDDWRLAQAKALTKARRPDLLK